MLVKKLKKKKLDIQKTIGSIINYHKKISPKVINLSDIFLTKHEIEILKLGLSFTKTWTFFYGNVRSELETDIYHCIRKPLLAYHLRDSTYEGKLFVKNESTFTQRIMKIKN